MQDDRATATTPALDGIDWERRSTSEHHARRRGCLVGLVTRPAPGVFWAHRISWCPSAMAFGNHGPKTRHRTLTDARRAIEESAPGLAERAA